MCSIRLLPITILISKLDPNLNFLIEIDFQTPKLYKSTFQKYFQLQLNPRAVIKKCD